MAVTPFVDALPIPRVLKPKERTKGVTYYEVRMEEFFISFTVNCHQQKYGDMKRKFLALL